MSRTENSSLNHKGLTYGAFFEAVQTGGFILKTRGDDKLVCRGNEPKAQFPVYTVKRGAVLPENSLFSAKERKDIGFHFRSLPF